jgi:signal transduction histidine kinase
LKEALRNVERHARGASVGVRVRSLGGRVVLSVADDGPGFEVPDSLDALSEGRHYGVTGMRERARVAGGDLMVESAPGEGCVISAWVPMRSPETPVEPAEEARSVPGYTWQ